MDLINSRKNNIVKVLIGNLDPNVEDLLKQAEIEEILGWIAQKNTAYLVDPASSPCFEKHCF